MSLWASLPPELAEHIVVYMMLSTTLQPPETMRMRVRGMRLLNYMFAKTFRPLMLVCIPQWRKDPTDPVALSSPGHGQAFVEGVLHIAWLRAVYGFVSTDIYSWLFNTAYMGSKIPPLPIREHLPKEYRYDTYNETYYCQIMPTFAKLMEEGVICAKPPEAHREAFARTASNIFSTLQQHHVPVLRLHTVHNLLSGGFVME